ncbi:cytochrome P450, partial [Mycena olivaceomarginata]
STHPAAQKRAQHEVDAYLGGAGRLLTLDDHKALPYVSALIKEVLRSAPVAPLGESPRSMLRNLFSGSEAFLFYSPRQFACNAFSPDLRRNDNRVEHLVRGPMHAFYLCVCTGSLVFGYGRRVCPGAALAEDTLFLAISNILATFTISKALDGEGKETELCVEWRTGTVTFPLNLRCRIVPRAPDIIASLAVAQ